MTMRLTATLALALLALAVHAKGDDASALTIDPAGSPADRPMLTAGQPRTITLRFRAPRRAAEAALDITLPDWAEATPANTRVNVIGRGEVRSDSLALQSVGRVGSRYTRTKVGECYVTARRITLARLDLRPDNGDDVVITIAAQKPAGKGRADFRCDYTLDGQKATAYARADIEHTITDLRRLPLTGDYRAGTPLTETRFRWTAPEGATTVGLETSTDGGRSWRTLYIMDDPAKGYCHLRGLKPGTDYLFRLQVMGGDHAGISNTAALRTDTYDLKASAAPGAGLPDCTDRLNALITQAHRDGGGIVRIPAGEYLVRTIELKSNVWLTLDKGTTLRETKGCTDPEPLYYDYMAAKKDPNFENNNPDSWIFRQDQGHTFFRNSMFHACRETNIKVIGACRITGNECLTRENNALSCPEGFRGNKLFGLKLCTDIEIGGMPESRDLWYDPVKDLPYYIDSGRRDYDDTAMMHLDQPGHFAFLLTGCDRVYSHDVYTGKHAANHDRDIYDLHECRDVRVTNVYCRATVDDVAKIGSDAALGFTRKAWNHRFRNIIGDTGCNLIMIGSETQDDVAGTYTDNFYCTGSGKTAFAVECCDGGTISDFHVNSGATGPIHHRSRITRAATPFQFNITPKQGIMGTVPQTGTFTKEGVTRQMTFPLDVPMGKIRDISVRHVEIDQIYYGTSCDGRERWRPYDGTQPRYTAAISGCRLPDGVTPPGGVKTAYIDGVTIDDISVADFGGVSREQAAALKVPELSPYGGNAREFGTLPASGIWIRHAKRVKVTNVSVRCDTPDGREWVVMDDATAD